MLDDTGLDYKLVIVGVNDLSLRDPTGMAFVYNNSSVSLREAGRIGWVNAARILTIIARVQVFELPRFDLT
jgi:hypothetical protein